MTKFTLETHHHYPISTQPPMASRWGIPLKKEKPPRLRGLLSSLAPSIKERLRVTDNTLRK